MIVFADQCTVETIKTKLDEIKKLIRSIYKINSCDHSQIVNLFIEIGEIETGLSDSYCKHKDTFTPLLFKCRKLSVEAAGLVTESWGNGDTKSEEKVSTILKLISDIGESDLPQTISLIAPEGFCYYGLYPECFIEAARQFYFDYQPDKVTVIGLRSIGTPLSALVHQNLEDKKCDCFSFTLRPRGNPFDRYVEIDENLNVIIKKRSKGYFVIVDEGPGLSGSSICGTIQMLKRFKISDYQIIIFPGWLPDSQKFISAQARELWGNYKKYVINFEDIWLKSNRLGMFLKKKIIADLSSGNWKHVLNKNQSASVAVYPNHERRKYLLEDHAKNKYISKFIGLGKYGNLLLERANYLGNSNKIALVKDYYNGFLVYDFQDGTIPEKLNEQFIKFTIDYFCLINTIPGQLTVSFDQIKEMIIVNLSESFSSDIVVNCRAVNSISETEYENEVVKIDGHVMPHEWIQKNDGTYSKSDCLEHHCDQFIHGCQNIAWDIAAFCIEFNMSQDLTESYVNMFIEKTGNKLMKKVLPFYRLAYLAFRIGFVTMGMNALKGTDNGLLFSRELDRYKKAVLNHL
jgi:hypothetical protein